MSCHCPCKAQSTFLTRLLDYSRGRPRLFNWMSILLLTVWVILVSIIIETGGKNGPDTQDSLPVEAFIESLTS